MPELKELDLTLILREQFGHEGFRPGQETTIRSLLHGRDVLAVLPTGAGKSLLFQFTSQLLPGLTLVVSPLIALMKDQAEAVQQTGLEVGVVNSAQPAGEAREALEKAEQGAAKLLYVTPERLTDPAFLERARGAGVSLLAVDEAHCVSQWGYDFRPSYLRIAAAAETLGHPTILALTATATPWVRRDIIERLRMRNPRVVVRDVDRPNLFFEVRTVQREEEDYRVLRALLREQSDDYPNRLSTRLAGAMAGSGIVYVRTTRAAEETAGWLRQWGISADFYHGQRRKADRDRVQDQFMSGELRVIAATNAFGLGVDKPDVRFVIHRDVPASVEEYFQEAGRAGRDGELARCTLIFRAGDLGKAAFLAAGSTVSGEELGQVARILSRQPDLALSELGAETGLGAGKLMRCLGLLEEQELVHTSGDRVRAIAERIDPDAVSLHVEEARRAFERSRVQMMRGYAETWDCRRSYLLHYFGAEPAGERCGFCDSDFREEVADDPDPLDSFTPGARVRHASWGEGVVTEAAASTLTIRFEHAGEHRLAADIVRDRGLLELLEAGSTARSAAPFAVGDRVRHPDYGTGEVERVTENGVTVLFESSGYHTLSREAVEEDGLLTSAG